MHKNPMHISENLPEKSFPFKIFPCLEHGSLKTGFRASGDCFSILKAFLLKSFPHLRGEPGHFSSKGNGVFLRVLTEWALVDLTEAEVITLQEPDLRRKSWPGAATQDSGWAVVGQLREGSFQLSACLYLW